jgi:hypothetical protein
MMLFIQWDHGTTLPSSVKKMNYLKQRRIEILSNHQQKGW